MVTELADAYERAQAAHEMTGGTQDETNVVEAADGGV